MQTTIEPTDSPSRPLNADQIRQRLAEGERLIASGQLEASALLLWSAFEAAVRATLTELGKRSEDPIRLSSSSSGLTTQAVAYGVIDPADRDLLLRFLPLHDAAAHGYVVMADVALLGGVSRITARTLDELEAGLPLAQ